MYSTCTVVGSYITVRPVATAVSTDQVPGFVGILKSPTGAETFSDSNHIHEVIDYMGGQTAYIGSRESQNDDIKDKIVSQSFSLKKWFRIGSGGILGERSYQCDATSSPTETCIYSIIYSTVDGLNNPVAQKFQVNIRYICAFYEPRVPDLS